MREKKTIWCLFHNNGDYIPLKVLECFWYHKPTEEELFPYIVNTVADGVCKDRLQRLSGGEEVNFYGDTKQLREIESGKEI